MKQVRSGFFVLLLAILGSVTSSYAQLAGGTYTIDGDTETLASYFDTSIKPNGISGDVILELSDGYDVSEYVEIWNYNGMDQYTLTIRPEAGASSVILRDDGNANSVILFRRAKNVIFDGSPGGDGSDRIMSIIQDQSPYKSAVQIGWGSGPADSCYQIIVKNCVIKSDGTQAIMFHAPVNTTIENCDISSFDQCEVASAHSVYGIYVGNGSGTIIKNNYIHDIRASRCKLVRIRQNLLARPSSHCHLF